MYRATIEKYSIVKAFVEYNLILDLHAPIFNNLLYFEPWIIDLRDSIVSKRAQNVIAVMKPLMVEIPYSILTAITKVILKDNNVKLSQIVSGTGPIQPLYGLMFMTALNLPKTTFNLDLLSYLSSEQEMELCQILVNTTEWQQMVRRTY